MADYHNNRVQKFTNTGTFIGTWGTEGVGNGQFSTPKGVALDNSGNIFIADTGNSRVQKFRVEPTSCRFATNSAALVIAIALAAVILKKRKT